MLIKSHILVTGVVQGIGYRFFVRRSASELGIKGWVRNNPDSSVELDIECEDKTLDKFVNILKTKHPWARVDDLKMETSSSEGIYDSFEIM